MELLDSPLLHHFMSFWDTFPLHPSYKPSLGTEKYSKVSLNQLPIRSFKKEGNYSVSSELKMYESPFCGKGFSRICRIVELWLCRVLANGSFITWRHPDKIEVSIEMTENPPQFWSWCRQSIVCVLWQCGSVWVLVFGLKQFGLREYCQGIILLKTEQKCPGHE